MRQDNDSPLSSAMNWNCSKSGIQNVTVLVEQSNMAWYSPELVEEVFVPSEVPGAANASVAACVVVSAAAGASAAEVAVIGANGVAAMLEVATQVAATVEVAVALSTTADEGEGTQTGVDQPFSEDEKMQMYREDAIQWENGAIQWRDFWAKKMGFLSFFSGNGVRKGDESNVSESNNNEKEGYFRPQIGCPYMQEVLVPSEVPGAAAASTTVCTTVSAVVGASTAEVAAVAADGVAAALEAAAAVAAALEAAVALSAAADEGGGTQTHSAMSHHIHNRSLKMAVGVALVL
ncbi:uncharacterized protein LOC131254911 [Magnolia sinica]|uniref:uncharacterized protein LOC131254911 n=1 Tax=Magnolia sinica TaxID=86752 RepID=UPI0026580B92|nr:uncharacterized protein LOC131254911 [Magnolia sinica]